MYYYYTYIELNSGHYGIIQSQGNNWVAVFSRLNPTEINSSHSRVILCPRVSTVSPVCLQLIEGGRGEEATLSHIIIN